MRAQPGADPRPRQPHARPPRPHARPRPGEHRDRLRRRRGRQQLGRDALRRARRLLQTVRSMTFVLPTGTRIDTAAAGAGERFAAAAPELAAGLAEIRDEIRADAELSERIAPQVRDQEHDRLPAAAPSSTPSSRWRSSGACWSAPRARSRSSPRPSSRRVPLPPHTTTAWSTSRTSTGDRRAVRELVAAGASATELMVAPTLIAAAWNMPGTPEAWKELPPESAALLVEFGADDAGGARRPPSAALDDPRRPRADRAGRASPASAEEIEMLWHVREGMHGPARGDARRRACADHRGRLRAAGSGSPRAPRDLQALLGEHGFLPGVAGHASAGNLHFLLTPELRRAGRPRALRGLHARAGRADRRQVRRLAEGRARDRHEHGPLRGARVGGEGDRADVAGQAAGRPRRDARARACCSTATPGPTCAT